MNIQHPEKNDVNELKRIWQSVFGDTEAYTELFFSKVFSLENSLVAKEDGRVIAMVFYPEYACRFENKNTLCGYICGAATLPQFRGQGVMAELLNAAVEDMRSKAYGACVLIPASASLFDYYGKFGFTKSFCYRKAENLKLFGGNSRLISVANSPKDFYGIYLKATENIPNIVLQSLKSYAAVMDEYEGKVYIYNNQCVLFENNGCVDELFCVNESEAEQALASLNRYLGGKLKSVCCYSGYLQNKGELIYNGMFLNLKNFVPSCEAYLKMVLE